MGAVSQTLGANRALDNYKVSCSTNFIHNFEPVLETFNFFRNAHNVSSNNLKGILQLYFEHSDYFTIGDHQDAGEFFLTAVQNIHNNEEEVNPSYLPVYNVKTTLCCLNCDSRTEKISNNSCLCVSL